MSTGTELTRILVVDDEVGVRESICDILADEGFGVVPAWDAEDAHKKISTGKFDLVLLDIWMPPGIDGVKLLNRWRDEEKLTFPVIMISAHATLDAAVEAVRYGASQVLEKPFSSQRLLSVIRRELASRVEQQYDPVLHSAQIGTSKPIVKLKGSLLHASAAPAQPVAIVGRVEDAPEFFARMIQRRGQAWINPKNFDEIINAGDELLKAAVGGAIYLQYPEGCTEAQQRALTLFVNKAYSRRIRIIAEFPQGIVAMHMTGLLSTELQRLFVDHQIMIPRLKDYMSDLSTISTLILRRIAMLDDKPECSISNQAFSELMHEVKSWSTGGLARLLDLLRNSCRLNEDTGTINIKTIRELSTVATKTESANIDHLGEDILLLPWREARESFEKQYYVALMNRADNNYPVAARLSGLERTYLYRKIKTVLGYSPPSTEENEPS